MIAREALVGSGLGLGKSQVSLRGEEAKVDGAPWHTAIGLKEEDQEEEHWVSWLVSH